MKNLSFLIKPASSACNLDCSYCFYHDLSAARTTRSYGLMRKETLEVLVKEALEHAELECTFAFQGGEPTLAGLDFYKQLIRFEKQYNTKNIRIHHALQTNGVLLNEDWATFLKENDFLVGISLDGPRDIHDSNRVYASGRGSHDQVMRSIELLARHGVPTNILAVITPESAKRAREVYDFFRAHKFSHLQFIPCLNPVSGRPSADALSLGAADYGSFLKSTFDIWFNDLLAGKYTSVRYFDNLVYMHKGAPPESCAMSGSCQCQLVIESNGNVYPCDFYATDKWQLGNIATSGLAPVFSSSRAIRFVETSSFKNRKCPGCKWLKYCRNGCRRDREFHGEGDLNHYCEAYYDFFEHAGARLSYLAQVM